jgi:predicted Zn-dependent protease
VNDALTRAREATDRDPSDADAHELAARALIRFKRYDEAITELVPALSSAPRPSAYAAFGEARLGQGNVAAAEAAFRAGVSSDPDSIEAHVALAQFFQRTGRPADAEQELTALVAKNPSSELANRSLAALYIAGGRRAEAEPYMRAAAAQTTQKLRSALALADFYVADHRDADARAVLEAAATGPLGDLAKARLAALNTKE